MRRHGSFVRGSRALLVLAVLIFVLVGTTATFATVGVAQTATDAPTTADGEPADGKTPNDGTADAAGSCDFPFSQTDATGTTVDVAADPERVVALQPSAAQTMWEIGARDEVVGMPVNQYTSYLEGYQEPTNVVAEDDYTVDVEAVVDLQPDLVLAPNVTPADTVRQLRNAGQTVYYFEEAESIEDVYEETLTTGRLTGNCEGAEERTASMRGRIDRVRETVEDEPRPSVIYPLGGGVVAGSDTFLHEIITTAGGSNLAAEAGISGYGQISAEVIVAEDPQWLILNEGLPTSAIQMDAYNRTTAIREDQVIRVDPNYANQPAPRVAIVVEQIARSLHPEAMAGVDGTATPSGDDGTTTTDAPTATGTEAPGQPGFGLAAGFVAVLVALFTVTRRER